MKIFSEQLVICLFGIIFYLENFRARKTLLFSIYVVCLFDAALKSSFKTSSIGRLHSCYHKCIKLFFGYKRYNNVTGILLLAHLMDQYFLLAVVCRLSASSVVHCSAAGWRAGRPRGRSGGPHCTAGQYGYAPLRRHLVSNWVTKLVTVNVFERSWLNTSLNGIVRLLCSIVS